MEENKKNIGKIGLLTAIAYVIANMVGTGVFTSLGFQLAGGVTSIFSILMLWLMGGIIAFTGAQVYGELGSVMPRSGGEYNFLSAIYHPALGFMSGFFSMFVGFAAPIALAAITLSQYFGNVYAGIDPRFVAAAVIIVITVVHSVGIKSGSIFQLIFTILKVLLIVVFIVIGLFFTEEHQDISVLPTAISWEQILSSGFAVSLIFVYYSYSGWNASAYFVSELKNPAKNLPRSLIIGTVVVAVLYLLLNFTFLYVSPIENLTGQLDVGAVAATDMMGAVGGKIISGVISILLISTISSMIFVGPRVIQTIGEDYKLLRFMNVKTKNNVPIVAILIQSAISLILLFTSSFEILLSYLGIVMNIFALLTVCGVFVHRYRFPKMKRPYKTWGYPVVPIVFALFVVWNMIYMFKEQLIPSLIAISTLVLAFAVWALVNIPNFINKTKK